MLILHIEESSVYSLGLVLSYFMLRKKRLVVILVGISTPFENAIAGFFHFQSLDATENDRSTSPIRNAKLIFAMNKIYHELAHPRSNQITRLPATRKIGEISRYGKKDKQNKRGTRSWRCRIDCRYRRATDPLDFIQLDIAAVQ